MSVNKVTLLGYLGGDVETKFLSNGDAVANANLATSERWKDKNGEQQEKTEWHRLVFFKRQAEIAGEYLRKGSQIYVEGKLQTRKWQDKEGRDCWTTEIVVHTLEMLRGKDDAPRANETKSAPAATPKPQPAATPKPGGFGDFDDDIPFSCIGRGIAGHVL